MTKLEKKSDNQTLADRTLTIAVGYSRRASKWKNRQVRWSDVLEQLRHCIRTGETVAEYHAMSTDDKSKVKDVGGFVGGSLWSDGHREAHRMISRSLVTLDVDDGDGASIFNVEAELESTAYALYTTHSHTPEHPRFRVIIPLSRDVSPDEFEAISRHIAKCIDIETVDPASFRINQLMYWPSCPSDGEYILDVGNGNLLDADYILSTFRDWENRSEWPVSSKEKTAPHQGDGTVQDPRLKTGPVGDFCRAYTITEAIAAFLSDIYETTDVTDRYTYKAGSSSKGLIVYDDIFAYSHHATDPIYGQLCNAYDLVRIHKFGHLDVDAGADTKTMSSREPAELHRHIIKEPDKHK